MLFTAITSVHVPVRLDVAPGNAERTAAFPTLLVFPNPPLVEVCLVGGLTEEPEHQLMEVRGHAHKQARGSHQDAGVQE